MGMAASMGAFLLSAGTKGKRLALPNSTIMIHQPSGGAQGQATDMRIHTEWILDTKKRLNKMLSEATGQPLEVIERDTERDNFMTAQQALEYGLIDKIIDKINGDGIKIIVIDFHAEATSEKRAMGFYVDGRVSAIFGTHTHVQTSDNQILPQGTGYITDLGMTGPYYSILGVSPQNVIEKFRTGLPVRFTNDDGPCVLEGCLFEIDEKSGKTVSTALIRR